MARITIIPVSMLLAYVFFAPTEPFESIDDGLEFNVGAPEAPVLLPANPAYASGSEETFDAESDAEEPAAEEPAVEEPAVEEPAVEEPVAEGSSGREPADIAELLAALVHARPDPHEQPQAEPAAEEFLIPDMEEFLLPDMAVEPTIEIAIAEPAVEEPAVEEPAVEEPAVEEPASDQAAVDGSNDTADSDAPVLAAPEPKPELTPAMAALRDRLRRTTATFYQRTLSTSENTATDLMNYCLAFGCESQISQGTSSSAKKLNGITHLCWNYPCGGFEPLTLSEGRIAAKIGYGVQQHHSQLLAVLAMSRVQANYPMRVGQHVGTVADLVEHEKLSCRAGDDLSLKLIGLSYYVEQPTWTNRQGEEWSIERIVKEELDKPFPGAEAGGTYRLMGLSRAVAGRIQREQPVDGQFERAQEFIEDYQDYALTLQNSDGSWGPQFLAAKGTSRDPAVMLRSTGHVLQWLVMSLPEEQMEDARIVRSVEYVNRLLGSSRYRNGVRSLSAREIGSVMHAVHALMVYDRRYLAPRTPKPEPTAETS